MNQRSMECLFAEGLLRWHSSRGERTENRFWWRKSTDPYQIFVSEVLLARTRADRVAPISRELVRRWPSFCQLSQADVSTLEQILRPLGFHRVRAKALVAAAAEVCERWGGALPMDAEFIAKLPRSGRYVANAVLAYARCERRVAVDVNVARVLSRTFGLPVGRELHKDEAMWSLASNVARCVQGCQIRELNWSLLDVGREVCTPRAPRCHICPVADICSYRRATEAKPQNSTLL